MKKLLIVDDSRVSRMMIRSFVLAKRPDWTLIEAVTGNEAIEMVQGEPPDYCTMDINMPGMNGIDAAEQILAKYPDVRVAIFTANIQARTQERAQALGSCLVAKPVSEKSIVQIIDFFEAQS